MNIIDILNGRGGGAILLAIILAIVIVTSLVKKSKPKQTKKVIEENTESTPLDLNDEDATVACLIAAIECRNEFKKNVKVVSVRRI